MKHFFIIWLLLAGAAASAQTTTQRDTALPGVVISGYTTARSSLNVQAITLQQMSERAPFNLSDALAEVPGVSQMSTGNAISKPVIRGLYGNRILVLYSGMRFDNQQWQDEHGLGLSQIGINRVELIKGPASLLYGSDAIGGVINVIEEKPVDDGHKIDLGKQAFSNTLGTLSDIGYSVKHGDKWFRMRLGIESHADYTDGKGTRVLNSRNSGAYIKAGMGFTRRNWTQENSYNFSLNQFGFIMPDLNTVFTPDDRWSRAMSGPHHIVMLNLLSSQNTFALKSSTLKLNAGIQSNSRREDEGGGQISLNMHLLSLLQSLRWEKQISSKVSFAANQQLTYENNTNYGGRIIVPDANMLEVNLSGYLRYTTTRWILEAGAGANNKYVSTIATRSLNMPGEEIQPFTRNNIAGNGMLGAICHLADDIYITINAATGSRTPNLAELSSNGVHEGVYRYEIGKPDLHLEQNMNTDVSITANGRQLQLTASAYYNRFFNYVYLAPTADKFYGFQVFRYRQQDALIYGSDVTLRVLPASVKWLQIKETFATTYGVLEDGGYLPFIPAARSATSLRIEKKLDGDIKNFFIEPEFVYVFEQDRPAQFETMTGDYALINLYMGTTIKAKKGDWHLGLTGTNLTNRVYADHLSRLKYYGLYNQGLNIVISLRKDIKW